ncbi:MAG: HEAT repeat domain-containing protein [Candidatus Latescibacteria bacterium]|nr:HEAT repeat domain-containing protein [Candidatus Latescibacterota bacterium]
MNAGVLEFVWTRLIKGMQAHGPVRAFKGLTPSVALTSSRDQVQNLSPFRLLSLVEKGKKRPGQEILDLDAVRAKVRDYLRHEDWRIRNVGVKLVGLIDYREMLPALLGIWRDRTPDTFLRRLFGGDFRQVGFIRRNILKTAGDLGLYSQEVKDALRDALTDPYYEVRSCSAATLRRLAEQVGIDPEVEQGLLRCLRDRSFEVVMEAVLALGKVGGAGATKPVLDLYTHRNWRVREAALQTTHDLIERGVLCDAKPVEEALENLFIPCPSFKPNFPLRGALRDLAQDLIRLHQR